MCCFRVLEKQFLAQVVPSAGFPFSGLKWEKEAISGHGLLGPLGLTPSFQMETLRVTVRA